MRLERPPRPVTEDGEVIEPRIPRDLTTLTEQALIRLYSEFCVMQSYCQASLGWIEADRLVKKRSAKITRSVHKVRIKGTVPVVMLEAHLDLEPETRKKDEDLLVQDGISTITEAMLRSYTVGVDACSRELSRRISSRELHSAVK